MGGLNQAQNLWHLTARESISSQPLSADTTADMVVVGGGFTGCAAALRAAELGARVVLLEANAIGYGASGRNVGLVNAGLWTPPDEVEALLGRDAGARLNAALAAAPATVSQLIDNHSIECDAVRAGTLHLAHSPAGLKDLQERHRQQSARQAPVTLLDAGETSRRVGTNAFQGALHDARAFTLHPLSYCRGLARAAVRGGAVIHEATRVVSVRRIGGRWVAKADGGSVTAPLLVNATDSYHSKISGIALPRVTRAGYFQVATEPLVAEHRRRILPGGEGCWDTATVMSSLRLDRNGRLLVGAAGSLGHAGASIHTNWVYRKMVALYPFLRDQKLSFAWYGTIGITSDHLPRVVDLGEGALAAFGYSGRGIGPGTVFGISLAQSLIDNDRDVLPVEPSTVKDDRFATARSTYYEAGSAACHLLADRI